MNPETLKAALNRYGFDDSQDVQPSAQAQEWIQWLDKRIFRWASTDSRAADHIVREAEMLVTLASAGIPAPRLLVLENADPQYVLSVQEVALPDARLDVARIGLSERNWRAVGLYLGELHLRGPVPPTAPLKDLWEAELTALEKAGQVSAGDGRWLRRWRTLFPAVQACLTHGLVTPACILTDSQGERVLGLVGWSLAEPRQPGFDFLHLPEPALWQVLEGYGPSGLSLFLRAKLGQLVKDAAEEVGEKNSSQGQLPVLTEPLAEVFHSLLHRGLLLKS